MLFLLTAAPLGLGCIITDGDDAETGAETTSNPPVTTTGETDDPTVGTTVTPGDTTETPGETTETPSDTTETPSDTTAVETTGGVDVPEICNTYGDQITECYMDEKAGAAAAEYCGEVIAGYEKAYGADCVTAFEEFLACLSALTCKEFSGADPVCEDEGTALETACGG